MKKSVLFSIVLVCLGALAFTVSGSTQEKKSEHQGEEHHKVSIEEVNKFHDLLHPIWHEQYPAKQWSKIRSQADELLSRKEAIMKVRLRTKADNRAMVEERRQKFGAAVDALAQMAKSGSDDELSKAVADLHESFEKFVEALG